MGLGGTAKKLQKVANMAEELYQKLNQLRDQLQATQEQVETTNERVTELRKDVAEQRALVEAIAEQEGIDVESVLTEAAIEEAEFGDDSDSDN